MAKVKVLAGLFAGYLLVAVAWVGAPQVALGATPTSATPPTQTLTPAKPTSINSSIFDDAMSVEDEEAIAHLERISRAYAAITHRVRPSVVSIRALTVSTELHNELRKRLGNDDIPLMPMAGTGSGVILDTDGYIVTNNHVVDEADAVWVTLDDGRDYRAKVIGTDTMSDLAVIKIDADGLTPCRFGDSDAVRVGHIVLAIGSPFKFGHSVSHGIISAVGRSNVQVEIDYKNWLQTDAPINPGNSGGPLINTRGEVIGISVAIATESGGYQGVGFAIPSNSVSRAVEHLKRGEKIVRGYLGVEIKPVSRTVAEVYGLKDVKGALLGLVGSGTPAGNAGLKPEDIVLQIDGREVESLEHLQEAVAWLAPGTESIFTVWRGGRSEDIRVKIGAQPQGFRTQGSRLDLSGREDAETEPAPRRRQGTRGSEPAKDTDDKPASTQAPDGEYFEAFGMWAATLTPELREKLQVSETVETGVVLTRVDPLGEAFNAGLHRGFVLEHVNGEAIETLADFKRILSASKNAKGVRLQVRVNGELFHTVMRLR